MNEKIGVFDSGIGGLTVMHALRTSFPGLNMVYLGDLARVPYGGRSADTIRKYAMSDAEFLMHQDVSAIIIACNTASAAALPLLTEKLPIPVYGMIDAAAQKAASLTKTGVIGVIGTQATVASGAYEKAICQYRNDVHVVAKACPLLVPLIENGIAPEDPVASIIAQRYLAAFDNSGIDVLIMGCTHYPVYREVFQRLLPDVTLINTGEALAEELTGLYMPYKTGNGSVDYYVTEQSVAFNDVVRIMDDSVDTSAIRVDNSFI